MGPQKRTNSGRTAGHYPKKVLEGKGNNSMYRCDPQTKGVSLPSSSLVEKARSNLFLAGP
jgi:hypothetical protein